VARQTANLVAQSLLTKDGKQVAVGGVVVFAIGDAVAALSRNWDVTDTIGDVTMTAITEVVTTRTLDDLLANLTGSVQSVDARHAPETPALRRARVPHSFDGFRDVPDDQQRGRRAGAAAFRLERL
jgi:hypothetical protein